MSRSVTIASGKSNVQLPNGGLYQAGQTAIITDSQFSKINQALVPGTIIDNGPAGDGVYSQGSKVTLTSAAAAGSTPTKAEFDKVVADVTALNTSLTGTGKALKAS